MWCSEAKVTNIPLVHQCRGVEHGYLFLIQKHVDASQTRVLKWSVAGMQLLNDDDGLGVSHSRQVNRLHQRMTNHGVYSVSRWG